MKPARLCKVKSFWKLTFRAANRSVRVTNLASGDSKVKIQSSRRSKGVRSSLPECGRPRPQQCPQGVSGETNLHLSMCEACCGRGGPHSCGHLRLIFGTLLTIA